MKKLIILPILFVLMMTAAMAAYSNQYDYTFLDNVTGNPINNVSIYVFNCGLDTTCLNPVFWQNFSSGASDTMSITLPAAATPTTYAYYAHADGYVPKAFWNTEDNYYNPYPVTLAFNKVYNATALIDNFAVHSAFLGQPLRATFDATLSADTYSAFRKIDQPPFYDPDTTIFPELYDHYSALTNVTLTITNETDGSVLHTDSLILNLYMDTKETVEFDWTPQFEGVYGMQISTDVIDNQVDQLTKIAQSTGKRNATVVPAAPTDTCYATVDSLTWTPNFLGVGQEMEFTAFKISNYFNGAGASGVIDMNATVNITGPDNYVNVFQVPANTGMFGDEQGESFNFNWTPAIAGDYIVTVTATPDNAALCTGTIIAESAVNTFTVAGDAVNQDPVISNTNPASPVNANAGEIVDFNFTATDPDGDDMTVYIYVNDALDTQDTVTSGDVYAFTHQFTASGAHNVTVRISDGSRTDSYTWDVNVGTAPNVTAFNPVNNTFNLSRTWTQEFNVTVEDYESATMDITWNVINTTSGANVFTVTHADVANASTDAFSYRFNNSGEFSVEAEVSDGIFNVSQTWQVNVSQCVTPYEGMEIDQSMTFCTGIYDINSVTVAADDIAVDGNNTVFNGDGTNTFLAADGRNNFTLYNISIDNASNGLRLLNSSNVVLDNLTMGNIAAAGIDVVDSNSVRINNSRVEGPGKGIHVENSTLFSIESSRVNVSGNGLELIDSGSVQLTDVAVDNAAAGIFANNAIFVFQDSNITNSTGYDFELDNNTNGTAINAQFNDTNNNFANSAKLDVLWYITAHVNDTLSQNVSGALVELCNADGAEVWNATTDAQGLIPQAAYTEFSLNETGRTEHNNHTVNVTAAGYDDYTQSVNLTGNWLAEITLTPTGNLPPTTVNQIPATPVNLTTNDSQVFNATVVDPEGANMTVEWLVNGTVENTLVNVTNGTNVDFTRQFTAEDTFNVTIRVTDNESAVTEYEWTVNVTDLPTFVNLIINEIMYDAAVEWIEIFNPNAFDVNLSSWLLNENGNDTLTPIGNENITANGYAILTNNTAAEFAAQYPNYTGPLFNFNSNGLANGGEQLLLYDNLGRLVDNVTYEDSTPWPTRTENYSIELLNPALDNNDGANWNLTLVENGTPGEPNSVTLNQAPTITLTAPATPLALDVNATQTFNATFTDPEAGNMTVTWIVDSTVNRTDVNVSSGSYRTFDYTFDTEKVYNVTVQVEDDSNNTVSYTWNVTATDSVDNVPVVNLTSPVGITIRNYNGDVTFNYTATDDNLVDNCTLWTDTSGNWTNESTNAAAPFTNFTLNGLSSGTYAWNVQCFDNGSQEAYAAANATFTLNRVGIIDGYVFDEASAPLAGANVEIKQGLATVNATATDAAGYYSMWVDAGTYDVLAFNVGYNQNLTANVTVTSGNTTEVNATLTMPPAATGNLSGKVTDGTNNIYNAVVELRLGASTIYSTYTNQSGDYTFTDLNDSNYTLRVTKSGFDSASSIVEVTAGNSTAANVTLTAGANSGRILGGVWNTTLGKVQDAEVSIYEFGTGNLIQIVKSDSNGDYVVNGLVTSTAYDLNATAVGYTQVLFGPTYVVLSPGGTSTQNNILLG